VKFLVGLPGLALYAGDDPWRDVSTDDLREMAQAADRLGFDFINVSTHFAMHRDHLTNLGPRWVHSLSATGFLLGATKRIKTFCKLVVPNHNPVELAKALATLDWASGGRVIAVPMVGYMPWESEVVGVRYEERGAMMDEHLDAMVELWTAEEPEFAGRYVSFRDIVFDPKPVQEPFPLWFGARTLPALRRVARLGNGWVPSGVTYESVPRMLEYIRSRPAFEERPRPLEVHVPWVDRPFILHDMPADYVPPPPPKTPDEMLERIATIASLGGTSTSASLGEGRPKSVGEFVERLEWFAAEVMPAAREITPAAVAA
jgi:alkanesulfonate monooxygenase SsuD/methylene tetrahydromethanopterin reductase-like flavin-dependent oxidoreductase (luciferase family)